MFQPPDLKKHFAVLKFFVQIFWTNDNIIFKNLATYIY